MFYEERVLRTKRRNITLLEAHFNSSLQLFPQLNYLRGLHRESSSFSIIFLYYQKLRRKPPHQREIEGKKFACAFYGRRSHYSRGWIHTLVINLYIRREIPSSRIL